MAYSLPYFLLLDNVILMIEPIESSNSLQGVSLLVVDDDADNRNYLVQLMLDKASETTVFVAKHGKQALSILGKKAVDLILLDWEMPVMNGGETLQALQQDVYWRYIPVIMYTGAMTSYYNLEEALQNGAVDFLRKPAEPVELLARIRSILRQKQLEEQRRHLEKRMVEQQKEFLEQTVQLLKKETNDYLLLLARKNEVLAEIQLRCTPTHDPPTAFQKTISRFVKQSIREDNYWEDFLEKLNQTDPQFVKRLNSNHPKLSPGEVKVCALLRFGLDNKSIANLLQISNEGIKKSRYRIRKKLLLDKANKLEAYLTTI